MLAVEGLFVWYDGMKVTKEWNSSLHSDIMFG